MNALSHHFHWRSIAIAICLTLFLAEGCGTANFMVDAATQVGVASYYSNDFQGRKTSSGEIFDNAKFTAAHRTFPFGTLVKVTNLATCAETEVRINDRGPVKHERIIDLSLAAAKALGIDRAGLAKVRIEVLKWGVEKTS